MSWSDRESTSNIFAYVNHFLGQFGGVKSDRFNPKGSIMHEKSESMCPVIHPGCNWTFFLNSFSRKLG